MGTHVGSGIRLLYPSRFQGAFARLQYVHVSAPFTASVIPDTEEMSGLGRLNSMTSIMKLPRFLISGMSLQRGISK